MPPSSTPTMLDRMRAVFYRLRRIAFNVWIDLKHGSVLAIERGPKGLRLALHDSDYAALAQMFRDRIRPDDVLVDVGSSTGRVINYWLHKGHTGRIVGLESDPRVAKRASKRLRRHGNVSIVLGDPVDELPADSSVLYLFNPFDAATMKRLRERVAQLPVGDERPLVVYYNCKHVDVFDLDDRFSVERVTLEAPRYAPLSPLAYITRR